MANLPLHGSSQSRPLAQRSDRQSCEGIVLTVLSTFHTHWEPKKNRRSLEAPHDTPFTVRHDEPLEEKVGTLQGSIRGGLAMSHARFGRPRSRLGPDSVVFSGQETSQHTGQRRLVFKRRLLSPRRSDCRRRPVGRDTSSRELMRVRLDRRLFPAGQCFFSSRDQPNARDACRAVHSVKVSSVSYLLIHRKLEPFDFEMECMGRTNVDETDEDMSAYKSPVRRVVSILDATHISSRPLNLQIGPHLLVFWVFGTHDVDPSFSTKSQFLAQDDETGVLDGRCGQNNKLTF